MLLLVISSVSSAQHISDGYPNQFSYFAGDTAEFFINGTTTASNVVLYVFDVTGRRVDSVVTNVKPQKPSNPLPSMNGFGYSLTFRYVIPPLPSGIYCFDQRVFFIVKSRGRETITVVYPTNTVSAYNAAGGKSLYFSNSTDGKGTTVSFLRPWDQSTRSTTVIGAKGILLWLSKQPDINFKLISDLDLDDYKEIDGSKILMIIGHSEYWTRAARRNLDQFVNQGGHALIFSGNTMGWQVRYSDDKTKMTCYRDAVVDSTAPDSLKTVNWHEPLLQYPIYKSIGCDWQYGAYGLEAPVGWKGYKIVTPTSPILAGTNLSKGDILSCQSAEYDCAPLAGFAKDGYPILDTNKLNFYKVELIGYDFGKKPSVAQQDTSYGTFIVFQKTPKSGVVVNTGLTEFTSLAWNDKSVKLIPRTGGFGGPDSVKIQRICRNIIDLLCRGQNIFSFPQHITQQTSGAKDEFSSVVLYPEQSTGELYIKTDKHGVFFLQILDSHQKTVFYGPTSGQLVTRFDLGRLGPGEYHYRLLDDDGIQSVGAITIIPKVK